MTWHFLSLDTTTKYCPGTLFLVDGIHTPHTIWGQSDTVARGGLGPPLGISEQRKYSPSPQGLTFPFWASNGICLDQVLRPGGLFVSTDLGSLSLTRTPSHTGGPHKRPTTTTSRQSEKPLSNDLTPLISLKDKSQSTPAERHQNLSLGKPSVPPQVIPEGMSGSLWAARGMDQTEMTQEPWKANFQWNQFPWMQTKYSPPLNLRRGFPATVKISVDPGAP